MRNLSLLFSTTLLLSTLAGCGSTVETCDGASCSTGSGGSATTSTSSTGSNGTGGASATSSTGVGGGSDCGGFTGKQCAPSEYCDYPTNSCSVADEIGNCKPRPGACDDVYMATCACDGMVYSNPCEAQAAGVDVNDNGCKAPPGKFACGSTFCEVGVSYCRRSISDIGGEPSSYLCESLPPACGNPPSCACLTKVPCGSSCEASSDGGFIVTCAGG